jgi:hypothetical protein
MSLPNIYTSQNETGCCAVPNVQDWQDKTHKFEGRHFIRLHTKSFMYMPINMSRIMKKLDQTAASANAKLPMEQTMILSRDLSPWKAEQLYSVSMPVEGTDNVTLSGDFYSQVYEGPYKEAGKWHKQLVQAVTEKGKQPNDIYFCYTTCPKCAKHYGKNYVIGLAKI